MWLKNSWTILSWRMVKQKLWERMPKGIWGVIWCCALIKLYDIINEVVCDCISKIYYLIMVKPRYWIHVWDKNTILTATWSLYQVDVGHCGWLIIIKSLSRKIVRIYTKHYTLCPLRIKERYVNLDITTIFGTKKYLISQVIKLTPEIM